MKTRKQYLQSCIVLGAAIVALLASSTMAFAQNVNPGVLPPDSSPFGHTYGEWGARWWQYATSLNGFDTTGFGNCLGEPSGKVLFLAGTTDGSIADRTCTVPAGKAIFFPIINAEWSISEAQANKNACIVQASPSGTSNAALRACAVAQMDHVTALDAAIDGVTLRDLKRYRAHSPAYDFTVAPGNSLVPCQGSGCHAVADGYWIMLRPLTPGTHTVYFSGTASFPELNFVFKTGATYHLTVSG
jgi:hypothetical protein